MGRARRSKAASFSGSKYFLTVTQMLAPYIGAKKKNGCFKHYAYGLGALGLFYRFNMATL